MVERPGGKGRFVRVEKWDPEQEQYVPDRQGSGIPWPWDAVQALGERVCALRKQNQQLRARLHRGRIAAPCQRAITPFPLGPARKRELTAVRS